MRKFRGLLCSVSLAAALVLSGSMVFAQEAETGAPESATEVVVENAIGEDGISASDRQSLEVYAEQSIQSIVGMTDEEIDQWMNPTSILTVPQKNVDVSLESWLSMKEELGAFKSVESHEITVSDESIVISSSCEFENMPGIVTTTMNREDLTMEGIIFGTGDTSLSASLKEAGLNTVMGIGIVFAALVFLSLLISQFKHISKLEDKFTGKGKAPGTPAPAASAPAAAPVVEEEETVDDGELIAVIAAAIAAAEGTSTDGFVVRSIRKRNRNKWQRA